MHMHLLRPQSDKELFVLVVQTMLKQDARPVKTNFLLDKQLMITVVTQTSIKNRIDLHILIEFRASRKYTVDGIEIEVPYTRKQLTNQRHQPADFSFYSLCFRILHIRRQVS